MDEKIACDLHDISDYVFLNQENEAASRIVLWVSLQIAMTDNHLSGEEQGVLKDCLDVESVEKAVLMLKSFRGDFGKMIQEKVNDSIMLGGGMRSEKSLSF